LTREPRRSENSGPRSHCDVKHRSAQNHHAKRPSLFSNMMPASPKSSSSSSSGVVSLATALTSKMPMLPILALNALAGRAGCCVTNGCSPGVLVQDGDVAENPSFHSKVMMRASRPMMADAVASSYAESADAAPMAMMAPAPPMAPMPMMSGRAEGAAGGSMQSTFADMQNVQVRRRAEASVRPGHHQGRLHGRRGVQCRKGHRGGACQPRERAHTACDARCCYACCRSAPPRQPWAARSGRTPPARTRTSCSA